MLLLALLRSGLMCCFPTCVQGSSSSFTESLGSGTFCGFWVLLGVLFAWEVLALLVYPSCSQSLRYAPVPIAGHAHWTEVGGRIFLRSLLGVHWVPLECAQHIQESNDGVICHNWFNGVC